MHLLKQFHLTFIFSIFLRICSGHWVPLKTIAQKTIHLLIKWDCIIQISSWYIMFSFTEWAWPFIHTFEYWRSQNNISFRYYTYIISGKRTIFPLYFVFHIRYTYTFHVLSVYFTSLKTFETSLTSM